MPRVEQHLALSTQPGLWHGLKQCAAANSYSPRNIAPTMAACCPSSFFNPLSVSSASLSSAPSSCSSSLPLLRHARARPARQPLPVMASFPDEEEDELSAKVQQADWRAFRARLLQKTSAMDEAAGAAAAAAQSQPSTKSLDLWAHALPQPEPGCLLLANPTAFLMRQQYFHQAVIFLFAHSKEGSAGLILNRPTEYNLGQLAGFEDLLPDFSSCPLYMGGDVGANALHVVHGVPGMKDTIEIIPGVYMGGIKSMKSSVQSGESNAMDYRWFVRYAGWGPGQLEREVAMGVWYLACSSRDTILKHCIKLPKPLWREILELMGDPYADISRRAYGEM